VPVEFLELKGRRRRNLISRVAVCQPPHQIVSWKGTPMMLDIELFDVVDQGNEQLVMIDVVERETRSDAGRIGECPGPTRSKLTLKGIFFPEPGGRRWVKQGGIEDKAAVGSSVRPPGNNHGVSFGRLPIGTK